PPWRAPCAHQPSRGAAALHQPGVLGLRGVGAHKTLSMRTQACPRCGLIMDRDHYAARVIRQAEPPWPSSRGSRTLSRSRPSTVVSWGTREPERLGTARLGV